MNKENVSEIADAMLGIKKFEQPIIEEHKKEISWKKYKPSEKIFDRQNGIFAATSYLLKNEIKTLEKKRILKNPDEYYIPIINKPISKVAFDDICYYEMRNTIERIKRYENQMCENLKNFGIL